ncbi:MAG: hypothetical protein V3T58_07190 [Candidatus Hydrothermarchaeales archaeon]
MVILREKILAREEKCFEFLRSIPEDRRFVLLGGYAVSAFEFPRLSIDMDIAIPSGELEFFRVLVKKQGFVFSQEKSGFDLTYGGKYERYVKDGELPVSVDLLINSVQARQTNYAYSFEYINKNSEIRELRGWHPRHKVSSRIVKKEMLVALKIHSMRTADKRDIIMLCYRGIDSSKVADHLKNSPREMILKNLGELSSLLEDASQRDSIKGVFTLSDEVLDKAVGNCRKMVEEIKAKFG